MVRGQLRRILGGLCRAASGSAEASDGALLGRFVRQRDESAFELLLRRHGPMVLGVCRRILRDSHAAEDAFQATFLVLVRKAGSLRQRERVGGWLHGVAYRLALKARAGAARQRHQQMADLPGPDTTAEADWRDLRAVLDEEIARLPNRYREPFVLSYLQSKTNAEVARELGCPEGTVFGRLARARERLRSRLMRRGVTLSAAALTAAVSPALAEATAKAANAAPGAPLPAAVAELVKGALREMFVSRLRYALVVVLLVGLGTVFARHLTRDPAGPGAEEGTAPPAAPGAEKLPPGARARIGSPQFRFVRDSISRIAYSPDGSLLAAAGYGNQLETAFVVWDARTGQQRHRLQRESLLQKKTGQGSSPDRLTSLVFSPDNKTLAWAVDWPEKVVCLAEQATGKDRHTLAGCQGPLAFTPDGKHFFGVGSDGAVRRWSAATAREEKALAGSAGPLVLSSDGKLLATGGKDQQVHIWETATGKELRKLDVGKVKSPLALLFAGSFTFAPSRPLLALRWGVEARAFTGQGTLYGAVTTQVWDVAAGKKLLNLDEGMRHSGGLPGDFLAFASDSRTLYSRDVGGTAVRALEATTGNERFKIEGIARGVVLSPDGKSLASWEGRTIRLWEAATGKERLPLPAGHADMIQQLAFTPEGKRLVSASWDRTVGLWDLKGKEIRRLRPRFNPDIRMALALGGRAVVVRDHDGFVLWELATGKELHGGADSPLPAAGWVQYFEVAPDGKTLAWTVGGKLRLADLETGKALPEFADGVPRGLAFSPDGRVLAQVKEEGGFGSGRCRVYLRDLATGKDRQTLPPDGFLHFPRVHFLAGGKTLATEDTAGIRFWDVAAGKEVGRIVARRWSGFAPNGKRIVTGAAKGLSVQETPSGKECFRVEAPLGWMTATLFSPDGRLLAVAGEDGAVRLLDAGSGKERRTLRGHSGRVRSLAFSPDGKVLATGGDDTTIVLWNLGP